MPIKSDERSFRVYTSQMLRDRSDQSSTSSDSGSGASKADNQPERVAWPISDWKFSKSSGASHVQSEACPSLRSVPRKTKTGVFKKRSGTCIPALEPRRASAPAEVRPKATTTESARTKLLRFSGLERPP